MDTLTECPNHAGAFDCTPFCPLCFGDQETKKKGKTMNKIFLARLEFGNYLLTAWGETAAEAKEAIRKDWERQEKDNWLPAHASTWEAYADFYGLQITELDKGVTEWT